MRLMYLVASALLLLGTNICAKESEIKASEFPVLKAAVNSAAQVFIELVKLAGPLGTTIGLATMVLMEFSNEEQVNVVQQFDFDRFFERMDSLKFSVDHLLNEVKFQTLIEYQSEIKASWVPGQACVLKNS